jgi:hypothetical protein
MNVLDFQKMKNEGRKISMVTCYDYSSARAVAESSIDCVLVGDSLAMMMHGHPTTLSATTAMMALHTAAVARGAPSKFIVADLPFLSYRKGTQGCDGCRLRTFSQTPPTAPQHANSADFGHGYARVTLYGTQWNVQEERTKKHSFLRVAGRINDDEALRSCSPNEWR